MVPSLFYEFQPKTGGRMSCGGKNKLEIGRVKQGPFPMGPCYYGQHLDHHPPSTSHKLCFCTCTVKNKVKNYICFKNLSIF